MLNSVIKKLPQPLLAATWLYAITSVLGIIAYPVLAYYGVLGTFGSRFYVYLFYTAGLDDAISHSVALLCLAVVVIWVITLLIACVLTLWKKKYRLYRFMVLADIVATFGYLVYAVVRDDYYWEWFFSNLGWGSVLNIFYLHWFNRTIRTMFQQTQYDTKENLNGSL